MGDSRVLEQRRAEPAKSSFEVRFNTSNRFHVFGPKLFAVNSD